MHIDIAKLDRALDRTLEAAVDPSLWKDIVTEISDATGSFGANLIPFRERNPHLILHTDSMDRPFEDYFDGGWHINDWRVNGIPFLKRSGVVRDNQFTSRDVFEKHAFYRLHAKHGIGTACMVGWDSAPDDMLVFTLHRKLDADIYSDEELNVCLQMRERLLVSTNIMRRLSESRVGGMADAFEIAELAAVFFDRFGKVTRVTREAERMLGKDLTVSNRELKSRNHEETASIRRRMAAVISERWLAPNPDAPGLVTIEREDAFPLYVRIQRLGGNLPDFFSHSVGICLLEDAQARKPAPPEALQRLFGLTPKQAVILSKMCEGLTLREIADSAELSYETARSHLRTIFAKTKTGRQSELIALANRATRTK